MVVIRYEGPQGRAGHAGNALPDQLPQIEGPGRGLRADHRRALFRRHVSGLSIGHASPEAAEGGAIGLVEDGDMIEIDIPNRTIHLAVDDAELARRRAAKGGVAGSLPSRARARFRPRSRPMPR